MDGVIFETERWSLSDGPGTRTVVFLKGCSLHCQWCANPESQEFQPQIGIFTRKCIECLQCEEACSGNSAKAAVHGGFAEDSACSACGDCIEACPSRSRRWMGESRSAEDIVRIIKKDSIFYRKSGGGVTFSGGEPFLQPDFLYEVLAGCKAVGIHTAIETCGMFQFQSAQKCLELLDFILFDIKHMNEEAHRMLTGASNTIILENAKRLSDSGLPMVIRIPIIPALNDSEENIRATAAFVRDNLPSALGIEPLPYHRLGLTKYAALGMEYKLQNIQVPDEKDMKSIQKLIIEESVPCVGRDTNYAEQVHQPKLKLVG